MRNTIQDELELAKSKMIGEIVFQGNTLAKLTRDNVAIVEAMIRNDSAYIHSTDVSAAPVYNRKGEVKYGGSSAYWMTLLKRSLLDNVSDSVYTYEQIIKGAVEAVDRENSTHLNADKCGRQEITERIYRFDRKEFVKCLKNPDYNDMALIREISRTTSAKERARSNLSFASKFCHYACFYVFEGTEYQDNYSIYDGILKTVLPLYLGYYKIERNYDLSDYKDYRLAVDSIREASRIEISRNGFDHLPSVEEMEEGRKNLATHDNKVDFIVTHCCSSSTQILLGGSMYKPDIETTYLEEIRQTTSFKKWFFGHYHDNRNVNAEEILLYEQIIRIS